MTFSRALAAKGKEKKDRKQETEPMAFDKEFIKGVEEKTDAIIAKIAQKEEPAERLEHYQALQSGLNELYSGRKPLYWEGNDPAFCGTMASMFGGLFGAMGVAVATPAALPIVAGGVGAAVLVGGGTAGINVYFCGKAERKRLRSNFGSITNARRIYNLELKVGKLIDKEQKQVNFLKSEKAFNEKIAKSEKAFREQIESLEGKAPQAAPAPAEKQLPAVPAEEQKPAGVDAPQAKKLLEKPNYDLFKSFGG
jgi:hypothetical protein